MTIKKFALEISKKLANEHDIDLKRSHVHEILAALFGSASYAALNSRRLLAQHDGSSHSPHLDVPRAASRASGLGYAAPFPPLIASVVASAAELERFCVVTLGDVLVELGLEDIEDDELEEDNDFEHERRQDYRWSSIDLRSAVLHESLSRLADANSAPAHLALAQLDDEFLEEDESEGFNDGQYWFERQEAGRALTGVELEWANRYRNKQKSLASRSDSLHRAAALGSFEAAIRLVQIDPSDAAFERAARLASTRDAARLGELALDLDLGADALKWLRIAAQLGNTDAMTTLASELEPELKDAWVWVHLAKLLGTDVMACHAVGDDGLPADADEAGPIYAEGGFHLEPLSPDENRAAIAAARELYDAIRARPN